MIWILAVLLGYNCAPVEQESNSTSSIQQNQSDMIALETAAFQVINGGDRNYEVGIVTIDANASKNPGVGDYSFKSLIKGKTAYLPSTTQYFFIHDKESKKVCNVYPSKLNEDAYT